MLNIKKGSEELHIDFSSELLYVDKICVVAQQFLEERSEHQLASLLFRFQLVLRELLNNAICHGNNRDESKNTECTIRVKNESVILEVTDQGGGFPWSEHYPPPDEETSACIDKVDTLETSNYGMKILHDYTDEVMFNDLGNKVTIRMDRHT